MLLLTSRSNLLNLQLKIVISSWKSWSNWTCMKIPEEMPIDNHRQYIDSIHLQKNSFPETISNGLTYAVAFILMLSQHLILQHPIAASPWNLRVPWHPKAGFLVKRSWFDVTHVMGNKQINTCVFHEQRPTSFNHVILLAAKGSDICVARVGLFGLMSPRRQVCPHKPHTNNSRNSLNTGDHHRKVGEFWRWIWRDVHWTYHLSFAWAW